MGALLSADLPGHKALRERAFSALDASRELQSVEFKESASWETLKLKIIRTAMAMANLRDGGLIIIGVSERDGEWERVGILDDHAKTFDPDIITDQINSFASPHVNVLLVSLKYRDNKTYFVLAIEEFQDTPVVCKKNSPDDPSGRSRALSKGDFFVRPPGKPQTTRVVDANQMHELFELVAEKRARKLLGAAQRAGLVPSDTAESQFDRELEGM